MENMLIEIGSTTPPALAKKNCMLTRDLFAETFCFCFLLVLLD